MKKFYITTPIYYVNAKPHIGHAYTTVAADALARFHRLRKEDVFLLTGTDEHGLNIQKKAEDAKVDPQVFVDENAKAFEEYWKKLGIGYDNFIRTSGEKHKAAVQKAMQALYEQDAIYRGFYEGFYCVACEQFKNEKDLVDGRCPDHDIVVEKVKEECYMLKMGELQNEIAGKIESGEFRIEPEKYRKEILSFLKNEKLKDVSISRKNVSWGIELPFDKEHTTYVWADAFLSYLTGIGWPAFAPADAKAMADKKASAGKDGDFEKFWPADIQLIGKDILRVHLTIWPAMLLHLGIPLPRRIYIHGHILSGGRKMSKTVGNVISIDEMLEKFGRDGTRYLLLAAGTFGEDVDITMERLTEKYNADLANGLGNLVSRVLRLSENFTSPLKDMLEEDVTGKYLEKLEIDYALAIIWAIIRSDNKVIEERKPWELIKKNEEQFKEVMTHLMQNLLYISILLEPFMPETSEKIKKALETKKAEILFPRVICHSERSEAESRNPV
jgi:methionyl-tRNA synthetase